MRAHRYGGHGGNTIESRNHRAMRGTLYGEVPVGIPFQVQTKCDIIILLVTTHLHLYEILALKDVSSLLGGKDFFLDKASGSFMSFLASFHSLCLNF